MTVKNTYRVSHGVENAEPFLCAQDAWFWFIDAQEARNAGARLVKGMRRRERPCEPVDILNVLDRLYRARKVQRDHLLVLRHYGRRKMAPDARRAKEKRAAFLWGQAMQVLEVALIDKGIVEGVRPSENNSIWSGIPIAELSRLSRNELLSAGEYSCR